VLGANFDRLGVAAILHGVFGEQCFDNPLVQQLRLTGRRRRHAAGDVFLSGGLESELVGRRLQRVGLLVDEVRELLSRLGIALLCLLGAQVLLDLGAHLGERLGLSRLDLGDADDVETEVVSTTSLVSPTFSLNAASSNGLTIMPLAEETQVAALRRGPRVLGLLLGDLCEVARIRFQRGQNAFAFLRAAALSPPSAAIRM